MYVPQENSTPHNNLKIEAIIICKNYGDFLRHTLPLNMNHIDRIVVVTHPDDLETQEICSLYSIDCVQTTEFHRHGDKFNKGRAINLGMAHLKNDGWVLHMDADIVLPHDFRRRIRDAELNRDFIYGADRLNVGSYENWMKHKHLLTPQHTHRYLVNAPSVFKLGARLLHREYGYCPIGYFQLWHGSKHRKYPIIAGSAEHSDVVFAVQWAREHRALLPELFVTHLEGKDNTFGANWQGRKTKRFE